VADEFGRAAAAALVLPISLGEDMRLPDLLQPATSKKAVGELGMHDDDRYSETDGRVERRLLALEMLRPPLVRREKIH
jgi:hypothetical protein